VKAGGLRAGLERVPPAVYFFVCLLAGWGLGRSRPLALGLDSLQLRLLPGGLLMALAAGLGAWCLALFRGARTTYLPFGAPQALLTAGPFRRSRNPLYVALGLVLAGFALILDNGWILMSLPLLLLALDRFIVPGEERRLRETFGAEYLAYCARVRRWM
jgi:protein-S-isoprenylcysteine O-methyltransferase Ste14